MGCPTQKYLFSSWVIVSMAATCFLNLPIQAAQPQDQACLSNKYITTSYFDSISPHKSIPYLGPHSQDPFSFRWYDPEAIIMGKPMKQWLKFSLAFWHTMRNDGSDPFGIGTKFWPWESQQSLDPISLAKRRLDVFFELAQKLGIEYWCFHDRDISPELDNLEDNNAAFEEIAEYAKQKQKEANISLLWGTAQLFKHPRYMHGAATSPNVTVFAYAAAQVKQAMKITKDLGGQGYVFWGGREGYSTLLNTDMKLEVDNMARFLRMAAQYAKEIGLEGLMLEPKPKEPSTHQYDFDAATTHAFLLSHGLAQSFKLNIECNHATLAGHHCFHELSYASQNGLLGSIDVNTGNSLIGWDTDEFMTSPVDTVLVALALLRHGKPLERGGLNFDAKLRRESTSVEDVLVAHISGMDSMARGLRNAAALVESGVLDTMVKKRYSSWNETSLGQKILSGSIGLKELEEYALSNPDPLVDLTSGHQELYEMVLHRFIR